MSKNVVWKWQKCCGKVKECDENRNPVCKYFLLKSQWLELWLNNILAIHRTFYIISFVTLARPLSVSSSLQITNRCFRYASPYLWNQLSSSFRQPSVHCPPGSSHPVHITSSQSPPSLSPSTPRPFTTDLKLNCFTNHFLCSHSSSFWTALSPSGLPRDV